MRAECRLPPQKRELETRRPLDLGHGRGSAEFQEKGIVRFGPVHWREQCKDEVQTNAHKTRSTALRIVWHELC